MVVDKVKFDEYYEALINRNSQYLGSFYVGVKTTRIFCIATCRARKPKRENVVFYKTSDEALAQGFRACKVCKPLEKVEAVPKDIQQLIDQVNEYPDRKITDEGLKTMGLRPEKVRRWFKKNLKTTFQAYQRMLRMNTALEHLKKGDKVTTSAFDSGYDSLSGFNYSFKNLFNQNPQDAFDLEVVHSSRMVTPLGSMHACATRRGICLLDFDDKKILDNHLQKILVKKKAKIIPGKNEHLLKLEKELKEYFEGHRTHFTVSLDMIGTEFQIKVWNKLTEIPYGETKTYKDQSVALNKPESVRAVANANGKNLISIVIPCHRVVGSDGSLTGYSGGLPRKKWLLEHEAKHI